MDNNLPRTLQASSQKIKRYDKDDEEHDSVPEACVCSLLFTILGIGYLLPWNAFLSATSYFHHRLCSSTNPIVQNQFEAVFGLVYNVSATITLATMTIYLSSKKRQTTDIIFTCSQPSCNDDKIRPLQWLHTAPQFLIVSFGNILCEIKSLLGASMGLTNLNETVANVAPDFSYVKDVHSPICAVIEHSFCGPISEACNDDQLSAKSFKLVDDVNACKDLASSSKKISGHPRISQLEITNNHSLLFNDYTTDICVVEYSTADDLKKPLLSTFERMITPTNILNADNCPACYYLKEKHMRYDGFHVFLTLTLYLVAFVATTTLALFPSIGSGLFFRCTILLLVVCGASSAVYAASVLNFASRFPPSLGVKPFVAGHALAGVIISLVKISLLLEKNKSGGEPSASKCHSNEIDYAALVFFAFGSLVIVSAMVSFYILNRLPITVFYDERHCFMNNVGSSPSPDHTCNEFRYLQDYDDGPYLSTASAEQVRLIFDNDFEDDYAIATTHTDLLIPDVLNNPLITEMAVHARQDALSHGETVWERIRLPALTCFLVLFVTISVFPSWTYEIQRVHREEEHPSQQQGGEQESNSGDELFFAQMFLVFNVFDLIGRATSDIVSLDWVTKSLRKLLAASHIRAVLFVPLFLLCNHRRYNSNCGTPILFLSDWYPMLFTALFAYTNGLLISLTMMAWPSMMSKTDNEGAVIISFAANFGLLLGSIFSFLLLRFGTGEW